MEKVNPKIFRAYDIRGIYPSKLNEDVAYKVGQALVRFLKAKRIVVGRDMRLSSPQLFEALVKGVTSRGADVDDIGLVATEMLYFAAGKYGYDGGVMITASHNPANYNGFKLIGNNVQMIGEGTGMSEIKDLASRNYPTLLVKGEVKKKDIWSDYFNHISSVVDFQDLKSLKVVIDAGNAIAGKFLPLVFEKFPGKLIPMYFKLDGSFPHHFPNPLKEENIKDLRKKISQVGADLGVAFDGDADRVIFLDEKAQPISGDISSALLAREFLEEEKGASIVYNLTCSHVLPEEIKRLGGVPIRSRTGHTFIKRLMKEHNAIFGGEISGHYYFRKNFYSESGFMALLLMLKILSASDLPLSQLVSDIVRYFRTPEINIEIGDRVGAIKKLEDKYHNGKVDHLDGLTVEYKDWWFNARPSNTEHLLRIVVEAKIKELMAEKKKEILKIISPSKLLVIAHNFF